GRSCPADRPPRASGWATPGRSSRAARERPRRRSRRSRRQAFAWPAPPLSCRSSSATPATAGGGGGRGGGGRMGALMDLIAGQEKDILLAIAVDDWAGLRDRDRFDAHLSLGGGLDPTWLDLFSG